MPVYVLHGAQDEVIPQPAAITLSDIKHATARIRASEGHGMLRRPDSEAIDLILEWIAEQDRRRESGEADEIIYEAFH